MQERIEQTVSNKAQSIYIVYLRLCSYSKLIGVIKVKRPTIEKIRLCRFTSIGIQWKATYNEVEYLAIDFDKILDGNDSNVQSTETDIIPEVDDSGIVECSLDSLLQDNKCR